MKRIYLFLFTLLFCSVQLHAQFKEESSGPAVELNSAPAPWENNSISSEPYSASQSEPTTTTSSFWSWLYCLICKKLKHSGSCNPPPPPQPTTPVPFDGGLSVLLVAGAAYGIRRFKDKKRVA